MAQWFVDGIGSGAWPKACTMNRALMITSVCLGVAFILFMHGLKPRTALPMAKAKRTLPPMMVTLKSGKHLSLNQLYSII